MKMLPGGKVNALNVSLPPPAKAMQEPVAQAFPRSCATSLGLADPAWKSKSAAMPPSLERSLGKLASPSTVAAGHRGAGTYPLNAAAHWKVMQEKNPVWATPEKAREGGQGDDHVQNTHGRALHEGARGGARPGRQAQAAGRQARLD